MICICLWTGHGLDTGLDQRRMMFLSRISLLSQMFSISAERNAVRCLVRPLCLQLKKRFKAYMKQNGAVLAKGWLLGLQFHCLLGHDLYFTATRRADELAMKLRKAFAAQGIPFWVESFTNQQFVILTDAQKETLEKRYIFEPMGKSTDGGNIARFCTSWATTEEEVQTLIDDLKAL